MATAAKLSIIRKTAESRHLDQIDSGVQGEGLPFDLEAVAGSWQRCATDLLVNPDSRTAPHIVTDSELKVFRESTGKAIISVQEEIDRLYAIVRQEGYVVLLCNNDGVAIHHRGDKSQAEQFKYWGIWVGGVWSEKSKAQTGSVRASRSSGRYWSIATNTFENFTSGRDARDATSPPESHCRSMELESQDWSSG